MANFPDKANAKIAVQNHSKIDLGHQHITSIDFMQFQPSMIQEMIPGSKIDVNMDAFVRANPMPVPSFIRASLRHRGYFVPMRTIFRGFNDFITDSVHVNSLGDGSGEIIASVPWFSDLDLWNVFSNDMKLDHTLSNELDNPNFLMIYEDESNNWNDLPFDFCVGQSGSRRFYRYTIKGRQMIKILESLGYKVIPTTYEEVRLSALPLLALCKVYCDWYFPQQYTELQSYQNLLSILNRDTQSYQLDDGQLRDILHTILYVQFDSDFLVSAWDTPNQPYAGTHSDFKLVNVDSVSELYGQSAQGYAENGYVTNNSTSSSVNDRLGYADSPFITPLVTGTNNKSGLATPISEYLLHQLHSLTDYMKRHQLAGSRAFERFLLQYGKALPAEKLNRSVYLGASTQNLKIGDIYSQADTEGAALGDYAGKALSYGNGNWQYETDEFGYFIIVSSLVPNSGYCQGFDRQVMRLTKLDFFNGEFDSNGVEPITAAEVFVPQNYAGSTGVAYTPSALFGKVFGFLPRYYGYKKANDYLTGSLRLLSINGIDSSSSQQDIDMLASSAWYGYRLFDVTNYPTPSDIVHGPSFIDGSQDFAQWKRFFYNVPTIANPAPPDNFNMIMNFEAVMYSPCKSLWDTYEYDTDGSDSRTLEVNGVKHN